MEGEDGNAHAPPPLVANPLKWKKVLYLHQQYPDNYVDREQFLNELRQNISVRIYSYRQLVIRSVPINQQIASAVAMVSFFYHSNYGHILGLPRLLMIANSLSALLYVVWLVKVGRERDAKRKLRGKQDGKSAVLLMMTLMALTPVLWTLTQDISDDTVWTMTVACLFDNFLCQDYYYYEFFV